MKRRPVQLSCPPVPSGTNSPQATFLRKEFDHSETSMRYVILWLAGVPIVGIILLKVMGFI